MKRRSSSGDGDPTGVSADVATTSKRTPGPARSANDALRSELPRGTVQSLHRGLQILEFLITSGRPLRLADVAQHFAMDKASAFRFLQTLERYGLVAKDGTRKIYGVGGKLLHWAVTVGSAAGIVALARPHLRRLVEDTGESAHFGILSNDQALLLDYIGAQGVLVVQNRVGVYEPVYCTALGKAVLAFQSDDIRRDILKRIELKRYTDKTVVRPIDIERLLEAVRREGIATDDAEYTDLLYCVAAPVFGGDGLPVGAIGISMVHPIAMREPARIARVAAQVRRHAEALSMALAGDAPPRPAAPASRPRGQSFQVRPAAIKRRKRRAGAG